MRRTDNDVKLSSYFQAKSRKSEKIPYMTQIAAETNVSVATISRFAKRKNFYNFSAMRAYFNESLGKGDFDNKGLDKFLEEEGDIVVITSVSTQVLGLHIYKRLKELKYAIRLIDSTASKDLLENISQEEKIIFVTLTCQSAWYERFLNLHLKNSTFLISTIRPTKNFPNFKYATLSEFKILQDNYYEKNKSIRKLFNWLDDCINVISIELAEKNNRKKRKSLII